MGLINSLVNDTMSKYLNTNGSIEKTNSDVITDILTTDWDISDDFKVEIVNNFVTHKLKLVDRLIQAGNSGVISVDLTPLSSQEIDNVIGGIRRVNVRMYESFRFGIRFRDYNGGELRKVFTDIWVAQQYMYPDEIASKITIKQKDKVMFESDKCLITGVAQATLDNTNSTITEFEVTFITPTFSNTEIKDFGIDANYSASFKQ